jgi:predicted dithiol-disulfide oxidoreductase (DUF899 family)
MSARFPGESPEYRTARDRLLEAEAELRRQTEAVAELRRALPPGGVVPQDYLFDEDGGEVRLSELFWPDHDTLVIYSFMYGPEMEEACPSAREPGQDPRHVDFIWPIWNVLDVTPEGRGTDWSPRLEYPVSA